MASAGGGKKKSASGWTVFCGELRELLKSEPRKYSNEEVLKECGHRWKKLSNDEKKRHAAGKDPARVLLCTAHAVPIVYALVRSAQIYTIRAQESAAVSAAASAAAGDMPDDEDGGKDGGGDEAAGLPLARIKRIVRSDKDVKMVQVDAVKLISKATEMFIEALAAGASGEMKKAKRKTLKYADLENHVLKRQKYEFIHELVVVNHPKEADKSTEKKSSKSAAAGAEGAAGAQPGPKMTMMTAFFKPSSVPAKGRLPGEDDDEEGGEGREETPGADEEEENLDDE